MRLAARSPRVAISIKQNDAGRIDVFQGEHADHQGWLTRLEDAFGSRGQSFVMSQLNRLIALCQDGDGKIDATRLNGMIAAVEGAKPDDETQAMLAVQMAMTHDLATQALRRAHRVDEIPQYEAAGNMAVKLLRTYTMQIEALAKLQRGGQQVVKVVHVHPGGQAIVGNVSTGASGAGNLGGGGGNDENGNQPHAKAELPAASIEPMSEMWGEDAEREPVPIASRHR